MRKLFLAFAAISWLFTACQKTENDSPVLIVEEETPELAMSSRQCAAHEVLMEQLRANPELAQKMEEIEAFTNRFIKGDLPQRNLLLPDGTMQIPVVVNVLWRSTVENISDAQIQSQISVLNEDFAALNADYNATSTYNNVKSGDTKIRFVLDQVIRKQTNKKTWSTNDAMKKSSLGGINPTSPTTKLNIWVCNMGGGILGYAQFPGGSSTTDGVVCDNNAFGRTGSVTAPFNKGRTTTHEVGHWLNLRHIWGDATCGNDQVDDTPLHNTANYGCPAAGHTSTCVGSPVEMTMNYMDYTDDVCMYMFSAGQKARMQATYAVGGPRASFR